MGHTGRHLVAGAEGSVHVLRIRRHFVDCSRKTGKPPASEAAMEIFKKPGGGAWPDLAMEPVWFEVKRSARS